MLKKIAHENIPNFADSVADSWQGEHKHETDEQPKCDGRNQKERQSLHAVWSRHISIGCWTEVAIV